jgi:hypothetical protein
MRVIVHDKLQRPQVIEASRVLVEDNFGNPMALAMVVGLDPAGRELILTAHVGEAGGPQAFLHVLREMGIDKTVVVTDVPAGTPTDQVTFDG